MGIGGGGDGFPNLSKAIFLRTTTIRADLQVFAVAAAAAQSQSVVVADVVEAVYMENAKARCDVVFMIWFYPSSEIEDPFKGFL